MKELRCILFNEREVAAAVIERRRRMREPLPTGTVDRMTFKHGPEGIVSVLHLTDDDGIKHEVKVADPEVASALVAYCLGRRVPLPVDADKFLQVINDHLALMIRVSGVAKKKPGQAQQGPQQARASA